MAPTCQGSLTTVLLRDLTDWFLDWFFDWGYAPVLVGCFPILWWLSARLDRLLCDVRLDGDEIVVVTLRVVPLWRIPLRDVSAIHETTRWRLLEQRSGRGAISLLSPTISVRGSRVSRPRWARWGISRRLVVLVMAAVVSGGAACAGQPDVDHPADLLGVWWASSPRSRAQWNFERNGDLVISLRHPDAIAGTIEWRVRSDSVGDKQAQMLCTTSRTGIQQCARMILVADTLVVGVLRLHRPH